MSLNKLAMPKSKILKKKKKIQAIGAKLKGLPFAKSDLSTKTDNKGLLLSFKKKGILKSMLMIGRHKDRQIGRWQRKSDRILNAKW